MNRFIRLITVSLLVTAPTLALSQGSPQPMPGGGMMDQEHMRQMHENMSQMQEIMQQMHGAESGTDRERLMERHMEHMHRHMDMMRGGMMGQGMMGQGMMGNRSGMQNGQGNKQPGKARSQGQGRDNMDLGQRLELMESRMDQMQMMLEQMLEYMDRGHGRSR